MKDTLTTGQIADRLRADENAGWSHAGARALAEYLEELEQGTGEEIELDVVALRCEFSEYGSATECIEDCGYGFEPDEDDDEDDREKAALEYLRNKTTVIEFSGGIIIQDF